MNIAIVGPEEAKFTPAGEETAIKAISQVLMDAESMPVIVSGRCHRGGIDIWAENLADVLKIPKLIFPAEVHRWDGMGKIGYHERNIQIAQAADLVVVITPATLPPGYSPEPWDRKPCTHCRSRSYVPAVGGGHAVSVPRAEGYWQRHVRSGGCWTAWYAVETLQKTAKWIVI